MGKRAVGYRHVEEGAERRPARARLVDQEALGRDRAPDLGDVGLVDGDGRVPLRGQVGLVSLGVDWTVLARSRWPDHGLFARGRSRLYVHRGTGFYGFPLRVGVPGEASVLEVVPA